MEMRNCRRCGRLFGYVNKPICSSCEEQDEKDFQIVKEYIYDHPKCTMGEVSTATGVPVQKITKFLKEERLEIVEGMSALLSCESCGVAIRSGRFCKECAAKLSGGFASAMPVKNEEPKEDFRKDAKMHLRHFKDQ